MKVKPRFLISLILISAVIVLKGVFFDVSLRLPGQFYNEIRKQKEYAFEYIYLKSNMLTSKYNVIYKNERRRELFYIKVEVSMNPLLTNSEFLYIKTKRRNIILDLRTNKYLNIKSSNDILTIMGKLNKIRTSDELQSNRVFDDIVYFQYPFETNGIKGSVFKNNKGIIAEYRVHYDDGTIKIVRSKGSLPDFAGKYYQANNTEQLIKEEGILFKDILERYGEVFE